jgi:hypothetical protein
LLRSAAKYSLKVSGDANGSSCDGGTGTGENGADAIPGSGVGVGQRNLIHREVTFGILKFSVVISVMSPSFSICVLV